jgi:hypothetical protein
MITNRDVGGIARRWPRLSGYLEAIWHIASAGSNLPMPAFFEPTSVVEQHGKDQRLLFVGPDDVRAWTRHIAFRTRARIHSIEGAIVRDLARGEALPAAILLRSHIEAAALAAHCINILSDCARRNDLDSLTELIYRTMFGTALGKYVGRDEENAVSELLSWIETRTIQITKAIGSLDAYVRPDGPPGEMEVLYAILCEFAHPNQRGTMDFFVNKPIEGKGWIIQYNLAAARKEPSIKMVVNTLLISMRAGYSASELLRAWDFEDGHPGIKWIWPTEEHGHRIWETFLRSGANDGGGRAQE